MRFTPRTWMLLSLLFFAGAAFFWIKGNEQLERGRAQRNEISPKVSAQTGAVHSAKGTNAINALPASLLSMPAVQSAIDQSLNGVAARRAGAPVSPAGFSDARFRLSNTAKSLEQLVQDDRAILLRNALIDTSAGAPEIPANLQGQGEASSYIVQSKSAPDAKFRAELANANAEIVSYVPNNAYLVQATAASAKQLSASESIRAVLPYEPYYKLSQRLLEAAVDERDLPSGAMLRVTFFPGQRENGIQAVQQLGAAVLGEEPSPFGPQILIEPPSDVLPALARLAAVQGIEPEYLRRPANDFTRVQIGLSEDTVTNANYLDLTGSNVWVNINDTGIDAKHAALKGRVFSPFVNLLKDTNGHGTFVAGILAGDGTGSSSVTDTNGFLSATNANYRGIAPRAKLFELPLDFLPEVNLRQSDTYLQETAAATNYLTLKRTNSLISNNSWIYGGALDYDSAAARYDAAVRDALPGMQGEQGIAFVFPAGNDGGGNDDGTAGEPGRISSPGTAKNVITVGALEHARFITNFFTNIVTTTDETGTNTIVITNQVTPFYTATDSSNEVASYSSRGNVGIGIEGTFGRFKPDVVAPGSFIISARSADWPVKFGTNADDLILKTLNTNLGIYRLDNGTNAGTSYAAPVVSGMMALFQEFFETKAKERRKTLSPALMKALVISGARSVNPIYDVSPRTLLNEQGWGLINLQRSLPALLGQTNAVNGPLQLIDQSPTNALSTGEGRTWTLSLNTNGVAFPLRATLVWTDPPGNPNVGVKLVNDLDLVITNLESGYVFYGNDIESGTDFTTPTPPDVEGTPDSVNNVENIFIQNPRAFGTNFTITVRARRVNVNAAPGYQAAGGSGSEIVQDFALVISSDNNIGTNAFKSFGTTNTPPALASEPPTRITNGLPLLNQRVGANPLLLGANGLAAQWRFYTFTNVTIKSEFNSLTNGSNVAFVTFAPPNLSVSRTIEADIDLYVSRDPALLSLGASALANALKSTNEGGTEFIILTNAPVGASVVYYVAVKSEDQQAAEFSLMGISSDQPFQKEQNGNIILQGYPISQFIPDGSASLPGGTVVLALGLDPRRIATVQVAEEISHEDLGDLIGNLSHNHTFAVLNNHTLDVTNFSGLNWLVYNDSLTTVTRAVSNGIPARIGPVDGPGTLNNFVGTPLIGPWFLTMVDNAPTHTGRVENLQITLRALRDLKDGIDINTIDGLGSVSYPVDVPLGATNMVVTLTQQNGGLPLELFLGLTGVPNATNAATYQLGVTNSAGVGQLQYGLTNSPPLQPGATYFLTVYNPNPSDVDYEIRVRFAIDFNPNNHSVSASTNTVTILNNARTNSTFTVEDDRLIAAVSAGVRIDYPRVSDLLLTLTSPQGTRVVLAENRGGNDPEGFGAGGTTNISYAIFSDSPDFDAMPIKFAVPPFNGGASTNIFADGFETNAAKIYPSGLALGGWKVLSNSVQVLGYTNRFVVVFTNGLINFGLVNPAYEGTNFLSLSNGAISRTFPTVPGKEYRIGFASRTIVPGIVSWWKGQNNGADSADGNTASITGVKFGPGKVGRAFLFDGTDEVVIPSKPNLQLQQFTIEGWVNPSKLDGENDMIINKETGLTLNTVQYEISIKGPVIKSPNTIPVGNLCYYIGGIAGLPSEYRGWVDAGAKIPLNQWTHFALTFDGESARTYTNGVLARSISGLVGTVTTNAGPLKIGSRSNAQIQTLGAVERFNGLIDEIAIYGRALCDEEIQGIVAAGSTGKVLNSGPTFLTFVTNFFGSNVFVTNVFVTNSVIPINNITGVFGLGNMDFGNPLCSKGHVAIGTVTTNDFEGGSVWRTNLVSFIANSAATPITFSADEAGFNIDDVHLISSGDIHYNPEESLSLFKGERAFGDWRLDLYDTRSNQFVNGKVISWVLTLDYANPLQSAIVLKSGAAGQFSGAVRTNQVRYFVVQPCDNTTDMTIILTGPAPGGSLLLSADRSGFPTGNPLTDDYVPLLNDQSGNVAVLHLTTASPAPAPLVPGRPIYLSVQNLEGDATNAFTITARFSPTPKCEVETSLPVQSAEPFTSAFAATRDGQPDALLLEPSAGASSVTLNLASPLGADLGILVKRGSVPTAENYDYKQDVSGASPEAITLGGLNISSEPWYAVVYNNSDFETPYTIVQSETAPLALVSIEQESDGLSLTFASVPGTSYAVQVSDDLVHWTDLTSIVASSETTTVTDSNNSASATFYRVQQVGP